MRVVIHVGFHKTATTWLQSAFFPRLPDVRYIGNMDVIDLLVKPHSLSFNPDIARRQILARAGGGNDSEAGTLILSSEELSGNIQSGGNGGFSQKELAYRLREVFRNDDVGIVMVFRNQAAMIDSAYRQYVKVGGVSSLKRYLYHDDNNYRRSLFSLEHFLFDRYLAFYRSLFGEENVFPALYEDFVADKAGFLRGLCDFVGTSMPSAEIGAHKRINPSLTNIEIPFHRLFNSFSTRSILNHDILINVPRASLAFSRICDILRPRKAKSKSLLSRRMIEDVRLYYAESNRRLSGILGRDDINEKGYWYE